MIRDGYTRMPALSIHKYAFFIFLLWMSSQDVEALTQPNIIYGGWKPILPGNPFHFGSRRTRVHSLSSNSLLEPNTQFVEHTLPSEYAIIPHKEDKSMFSFYPPPNPDENELKFKPLYIELPRKQTEIFEKPIVQLPQTLGRVPHKFADLLHKNPEQLNHGPLYDQTFLKITPLLDGHGNAIRPEDEPIHPYILPMSENPGFHLKSTESEAFPLPVPNSHLQSHATEHLLPQVQYANHGEDVHPSNLVQFNQEDHMNTIPYSHQIPEPEKGNKFHRGLPLGIDFRNVHPYQLIPKAHFFPPGPVFPRHLEESHSYNLPEPNPYDFQEPNPYNHQEPNLYKHQEPNLYKHQEPNLYNHQEKPHAPIFPRHPPRTLIHKPNFKPEMSRPKYEVFNEKPRNVQNPIPQNYKYIIHRPLKTEAIVKPIAFVKTINVQKKLHPNLAYTQHYDSAHFPPFPRFPTNVVNPQIIYDQQQPQYIEERPRPPKREPKAIQEPYTIIHIPIAGDYVRVNPPPENNKPDTLVITADTKHDVVDTPDNSDSDIYVEFNNTDAEPPVKGQDDIYPIQDILEKPSQDGISKEDAPDSQNQELFHAYYAPSSHKPPGGYVRMSINEFDKLFKNAEIRYVDKEVGDSPSSDESKESNKEPEG